MQLQGAFGSDLFTYVRVEYAGCSLENPEVNCADDDELANMSVNLVTLNSQPNIFGQTDNEIIQFVLDFKHFFYLNPTTTQNVNIFYQNAAVSLIKHWWDFLEATEYELELFEGTYSQNNYSYMPSSWSKKERSFIKIYIRADMTERLYKREEYDILSYFGDIGGLLDIVFILGFALTSFFVSRQLHAALVNRTYRMQRYDADQSCMSKVQAAASEPSLAPSSVEAKSKSDQKQETVKSPQKSP